MSEREPRSFESNSSSSESEPQKQTHWDEVAKRVEGYKDGLGKPIDTGIIETVIALNVFDLQTSQSCEGHLNWGIAAPWAEIKVEGVDELWKKSSEAFDQAEQAELNNTPTEEIQNLYQNAHKLTAEANRPILEKGQIAMDLLNDFYTNRTVQHDQRIIVEEMGRRLRLTSAGAFLQEIADPIVKEQRLQTYQQEMADFTAYLKTRYLR
ncbi:MAG TPA: hypothetical protein VJI96_00915 [Candidatus Andersenbacteria bacterium]|nr:hypothetical protein [Candidatus Andersenbacteria bacterium]